MKTTRRDMLLGGMLASTGTLCVLETVDAARAENAAMETNAANDAPVNDATTTCDWLVSPAGFVATVHYDEKTEILTFENGLVRRQILLANGSPATVGFKNLTTGEEFIRAVGPESLVTIDGKEYPIGGLTGQPVNNYLKPEWFTSMKPMDGAYRLDTMLVSDAPEDEADVLRRLGVEVGEIEERFAWQKRPEWLAHDAVWPPRGKHVTMRYVDPGYVPSKLYVPHTMPIIEVHYEIYDGIPLVAKWIEVFNPQSTGKDFCVDSFVSEQLRLVEPESNVDGTALTESYNLHVECDYTYGGMSSTALGAGVAVKLDVDPHYPTQVNYLCQTRCLLRCTPPLGPAQVLKPGDEFESFRIYELLFEGTDRERRGLAVRRMFRTVAPWTMENPLMFHKVQSSPAAIREAIEQCRETGFELIIMSFGSGFNMENRDPVYREVYKTLADEARAAGLALGGYSLTSSRGAATGADNVQNPEPRFGVGPCLGSKWGQEYLETLRSFMDDAGLSVFENDGPYPGDSCASTEHPGHCGLEDSVWVQWRAQGGLYKWCRSKGIYVNQPDGYFLSGGNKTGMGYRETNWSLPRAEQVIIERQNIFDGSWTKLNSMGWMFVPLSQYHGGGAAATIEPLVEHLPHYDARFANLIGAGVQACYRGPRLFDHEMTKAIVVKWVRFYKRYRAVLDGELIHLRRATGRDWDGWLHVSPAGSGTERGLAFLYNPLGEAIEQTFTIPLYYTGLTGTATVRIGSGGGGDATDPATLVACVEGAPQRIQLDAQQNAKLNVRIPAEGYTWIVFGK